MDKLIHKTFKTEKTTCVEKIVTIEKEELFEVLQGHKMIVSKRKCMNTDYIDLRDIFDLNKIKEIVKIDNPKTSMIIISVNREDNIITIEKFERKNGKPVNSIYDIVDLI